MYLCPHPVGQREALSIQAEYLQKTFGARTCVLQLPQIVDVSSTQLRELLARPGRVFTRDMLLARLWGYDFFGDERVVDSHIEEPPQKLGWTGIEDGTGVGYRVPKEHP